MRPTPLVERHCCRFDFFVYTPAGRVVRQFIHVLAKQTVNPGFNVPFWNQQHDCFVRFARDPARMIQAGLQLAFSANDTLRIRINHNYECRPPAGRPIAVVTDFLRVVLAYVLLT